MNVEGKGGFCLDYQKQPVSHFYQGYGLPKHEKSVITCWHIHKQQLTVSPTYEVLQTPKLPPDIKGPHSARESSQGWF